MRHRIIQIRGFPNKRNIYRTNSPLPEVVQLPLSFLLDTARKHWRELHFTRPRFHLIRGTSVISEKVMPEKQSYSGAQVSETRALCPKCDPSQRPATLLKFRNGDGIQVFSE
jgi:hypothetical protein